MQSHAPIHLSDDAKLTCIKLIATVDKSQLSAALLNLAKPPAMHRFPKAIHQSITGLQQAYIANLHLPDITSGITPLIEKLMQVEGINQFNQLLASPIDVHDWHNELLIDLMEKLNLKLPIEPMVQATILNGKVHWRLTIDGKLVYDRHMGKNAGVVFTPDNSWVTDWKTFRLFKDSGKRFSANRITQQAFANQFEPAQRDLAFALWDELKQVGVLNDKNRLSHEWRTNSNQYMNLPSLDRMASTSDAKTKTLKKDWYAFVESTLFKLANDPSLAEKVNNQPELTICRRERTRKGWAGTGRVTFAKVEENYTQMWDVAPHQELTANRHTEIEEKKYIALLHYDHIPSSSLLKTNALSGICEYKTIQANYDLAIANLTAEIKQPRHTRSSQKSDDDLSVAISELELLKAENNKLMTTGCDGIGLTVAIPSKLHGSSDTTMTSSKRQLAYKGNVFFRDVTTHLTHLEERKDADKSLCMQTPNDFIKALGSFRYLYHAEVKPLTKPNQTSLYGKFASGFFKSAADTQEIDKMFIDKAKVYFGQR